MVESLAYCAVCFEEYDHEERVPLMLISCGHTFCRCCLMLLPEPLRCPYCMNLESHSLSELPKNILIYQIQAQLNPNEVDMCRHEDLLFYCKICKYPLCLNCVVKHSNHGLVNLSDPQLKELVDSHIEQIKKAYRFRINECEKRKQIAEEMLSKWQTNYEQNRELIQNKFEAMQRAVENQEQYFLDHIAQLFQKMSSGNERDDNLQNNYRVDVNIDQDWLMSNLSQVGNISLNNPDRQEFKIRRSRNVKALNWKYSGRIDALAFKVSREVYLSGLGVSTPYKTDKETTIAEMKVLRGNTTRSEVIYLHSFPFRLEVDFASGVCKVPFETLVHIQPNTLHTVYLKMAGAKTFKCVDSFTSVTGRDNTQFTFSNAQFVQGDESNRTDIQCGPIVDFYYVMDLGEVPAS